MPGDTDDISCRVVYRFFLNSRSLEMLDLVYRSNFLYGDTDLHMKKPILREQNRHFYFSVIMQMMINSWDNSQVECG